jgi:hypothetical protein
MVFFEHIFSDDYVPLDFFLFSLSLFLHIVSSHHFVVFRSNLVWCGASHGVQKDWYNVSSKSQVGNRWSGWGYGITRSKGGLHQECTDILEPHGERNDVVVSLGEFTVHAVACIEDVDESDTYGIKAVCSMMRRAPVKRGFEYPSNGHTLNTHGPSAKITNQKGEFNDAIRCHSISIDEWSEASKWVVGNSGGKRHQRTSNVAFVYRKE